MTAHENGVMRNGLLLLVVGGVLLVGGPLTPALWGGRDQAVLLMDMGQQGGATVLMEEELAAATKGYLRRRVGPGMVEIRAPAGDLGELAALGQRFQRAAAPVVPCDNATCTWDALPTAALFNRPAGMVDPPAVQHVAASRPAWLAGMAAGLLGLALLVMGWSTRPHRAAGGKAAVLAGALVAGALGGLVGKELGHSQQQVLIIKPGQRPRLPAEPMTRDALEETHNTVARVESPGFGQGLPVTVHAMPMGNGLLVYVASEDPAALPAFMARGQERLLAPMAAATLDVRARLNVPGAPELEAQRLRMLGELQDPVLTGEPVEPDPRSPLTTGILSALAGALLVWAAQGLNRRRS